MAEQVKVEDQQPASLDTARTQDRVKKDFEEATRRERERVQAEYEQRWRQHMAEVEQERVRWTAEATRALGAQQEALAAERANLQQQENTEEHRISQEASETQRLQQQFQDLRATSGSGKKGSIRHEFKKYSAHKARENPGSSPSDPGNGSDSSSDNEDNSDSSSSGSEDSLDNDDGSGTAAAKTTMDGTTVWNFKPYINYNAVEKCNTTVSKEDQVN
ncbi:hypothetical protein PHMEG_00026094 [Phytophthora megakarya]|uniref:Uncharacterized protein n=1 Tax=Phytophthora megakarya TaxID=4795 RepID=A0A225VB80_9STRA|nr:hypothetical protein PHMEG_00026094 [Phytophthora megakarya]